MSPPCKIIASNALENARANDGTDGIDVKDALVANDVTDAIDNIALNVNKIKPGTALSGRLSVWAGYTKRQR